MDNGLFISIYNKYNGISESIIDENGNKLEVLQVEFEEDVFNFFMKTTEFYAIDNLYIDHSDSIRKRLFEIMLNDSSFNDVTKYFIQR